MNCSSLRFFFFPLLEVCTLFKCAVGISAHCKAKLPPHLKFDSLGTPSVLNKLQSSSSTNGICYFSKMSNRYRFFEVNTRLCDSGSGHPGERSTDLPACRSRFWILCKSRPISRFMIILYPGSRAVSVGGFNYTKNDQNFLPNLFQMNGRGSLCTTQDSMYIFLKWVGKSRALNKSKRTSTRDTGRYLIKLTISMGRCGRLP